MVYLGDSQVWIHYVIKVSQCLGMFNKYGIIPWLFTEYDVARNSHVLHSNFSIPRATSYSVNSQLYSIAHF